MAQDFTWVPLYRELADRLVEWETRQPELIAFLDKLKNDRYVVGSFVDQDPPGSKFLLKEIDPFTFFGTFNRGGKDENRLAVTKKMKEHFGAKSELPSDFKGIPVLNPMSSWFIAYKFHRDPKDVSRLWSVFRLALGPDPLNNTHFWAAFDEALKVRQTNVNLTMGLFWIRPDTFINLDQVNRAHLNIKLPSSGLTSDFYRNTIAAVAKTGKSFLEISHDAWKAKDEASAAEDSQSVVAITTGETVETGPDTRYWAMSLGEGGRLWNQCRKEGIAALGWDYLGDLTKESRQNNLLKCRCADSADYVIMSGCRMQRLLKPLKASISNFWTTWTSVAGAVGQLSKRVPWDTAALRPWRGRQVCRIGLSGRD